MTSSVGDPAIHGESPPHFRYGNVNGVPSLQMNDSPIRRAPETERKEMRVNGEGKMKKEDEKTKTKTKITEKNRRKEIK